MDISLTPELEGLIQAKLDSGLYASASEVVGEALRLLRDSEEIRRAKLHRLQAALAVGEDDLFNGRVTVVSNDEELAAFFAAL